MEAFVAVALVLVVGGVDGMMNIAREAIAGVIMRVVDPVHVCGAAIPVPELFSDSPEAVKSHVVSGRGITCQIDSDLRIAVRHEGARPRVVVVYEVRVAAIADVAYAVQAVGSQSGIVVANLAAGGIIDRRKAPPVVVRATGTRAGHAGYLR